MFRRTVPIPTAGTCRGAPRWGPGPRAGASLAVAGAALLGLAPPAASQSATPAAAPVAPPNALVVERGDGRPPLHFPRGEQLVYDVDVSFLVIEASVGKVTQTAEVTPYRRSVLLPAADGDEAEGLETAMVNIHAKGYYTWYSLDSTIESRLLPQDWPSITYRQISRGTEKRRRENMIGLRDGEWVSSYRKDTDDGAPKGTRIWQDPVFRSVPEGTVDMLSAILFARTLVRGEEANLSFPMIDRDRLWLLTIERGEEKRLETAAGTFDVVEVVLRPEPYPGEHISDESQARFKGLFGIHGSIRLWTERNTGVAVRIEGDVPAGPFTLGVEIDLESFAGTPPEFRPVD